MPLIIGVENGIKKGFTEDDLDLINGFGFGCLIMITGNNRILNISQFRNRLFEANYVSKIYDMDKFRLKMNIKFIQKMKDANWSCNVSPKTDKQFEKEIKRRLFSMHVNNFFR